MPVFKRIDGVIAVNIHSTVINMLEESKWMSRLGLEVPNTIHQLSLVNVKANHDDFKVHVHTCTCTCILHSNIFFMLYKFHLKFAKKL